MFMSVAFLSGDVGLAINIIPKREVNAHFILNSHKIKVLK